MYEYAYYAGLLIVIVSHIAFLTNALPALTSQTHAWLNLLAAALIALGWMNR